MTEHQKTEDLLDIRAAAALLKVSETSLRRWTTAGKLPCLRIGGRRERRFRREDLVDFMSANASSPGSSHPGSAASIEDVEIPWGQHVCAFYESDRGFGKIGIPFIRQGLERDERCFVVAGNAVWDELKSDLRKSCDDFDVRHQAGQLTRRNASTNPAEVYDYFEDAFLEATRSGATRLRVLGDMAAFLDAGSSIAALLEFERRYNETLAHRFAVISVCQYDARRFSGLGVLGALKCHEDTQRYPLARFLGI